MDDINFFELELYPILNELKGIILDNNKIKEKYSLENIDSYIISEDAHIFIKYKWEDKGISKKALESYIEDCNKINTNSLKIVINKFRIDYSNNDIKLISEKTLYKTLKRIDDSIHDYLREIYYSNIKFPILNYIK